MELTREEWIEIITLVDSKRSFDCNFKRYPEDKLHPIYDKIFEHLFPSCEEFKK